MFSYVEENDVRNFFEIVFYFTCSTLPQQKKAIKFINRATVTRQTKSNVMWRNFIILCSTLPQKKKAKKFSDRINKSLSTLTC